MFLPVKNRLKLPDKIEDPMPALEARHFPKLVLTEVPVCAAAAGRAFHRA